MGAGDDELDLDTELDAEDKPKSMTLDGGSNTKVAEGGGDLLNAAGDLWELFTTPPYP